MVCTEFACKRDNVFAAAKKMPDNFYYGSTGVGSASHLTAELFKARAGIDIRHVPFRGAAPMVTEMLAGRIDVSFATLPSVIGSNSGAKVRSIGLVAVMLGGLLCWNPSRAR